MVRANFDNPQGVLKSGLYVSITLPYGEADHAILVKEASIGTDPVSYTHLPLLAKIMWNAVC